ncbi:MAG: putative anti-sigma regulatory factor, serine/threonine protein kinase [Acidimicrobiales bacterium]|nr:putative anti-sigma regulatory factor, serine/threonine protein kinase [Acidimicrobiales bacterium]
MTEPPSEDEIDEIRLTLPALASYARVARLAVTGLASRLGFTYDELEDLRIAVGEVFGVLVPAVGSGRLTVRCRVAGPDLVVEISRDPLLPAAEITELTRQILAAMVDEATIDDHHARIRVVKRLTS